MQSALSEPLDSTRGKPRESKGFTLVELLVVISIIAILSVIGLTIFTGVQKGARDAKRKGDLNAITKALEIYKSANGSYPCFAGCGWYFASGLVGVEPKLYAKNTG